MNIFRLIGVYFIIPTTILLTISLFVLTTIKKINSKGVKGFGYFVTVLLWLSASFCFFIGVYTVVTGKHPLTPIFNQILKIIIGKSF